MIRAQAGTWLLCAFVVTRAGEAGQSATAPQPPAARTESAEPPDLPFAFDGPPPPVPPGRHRPRRVGPGHGARRASHLAAPDRRPARRGDLHERAADVGFHPGGAARGRAGDRTDRGVGDLRPAITSMSSSAAGTATRSGWSRTRCAATTTTSSQNENVGFALRYVLRPAQRASTSPSTPIGGRGDGQITNERQYNGDWNPIWDVEVGRFDGGWTVEVRDPVQVAPLPAGPRADLGLQRRAASTSGRTRSRFSRACRLAMGNRGVHAGLAGRDAGRPGGRRPGRRTWRSSRTSTRT